MEIEKSRKGREGEKRVGEEGEGRGERVEKRKEGWSKGKWGNGSEIGSMEQREREEKGKRGRG